MSCIDDTDSIDLEITDGNLTAEIIISPQPNNQAEVLPDGLFVGLSVPPAVVVPYAGAVAPATWLLADGSAVSRSTYADLFAVVGTTYGIGDGSTTFNLPDMRGRAPYGLGTHADVNALGDSDGVAFGSRSPKHKHIVGRDIHSLTAGGTPYSFGPDTGGGATYDTPTTPIGSAMTDSGGYLTLNFIIKT